MACIVVTMGALVLIVSLALLSCNKTDTPVVHADTTDASPNDINILCIGNSYTWDAMVYVPYILKDILPDRHVTIGLLYTGGENLQAHYRKHMLFNTSYSYFHINNDGGKWEKQSSSDLQSAISVKRWNMVTLQQSSKMTTEPSYYEDVPSAIGWVKDNIDSKIATAWLLTPAYPVGGYRITHPEQYGINKSPVTSDEMFEMIAECVKSEVADRVDFIMPVGTAVQNARHSTLSTMGRGGSLTNDGVHLQEGIPRLIAAYAVCQSIIDHLNLNVSIDNSQFVPTDEFVKEHITTAMQTGLAVGLTDNNVSIARQCALAANSTPYQITVSSE